MSTDAVERIGQSRIQHGPGNDRVYLMDLAPEETPEIIAAVDRLAVEKGYSKVFAKVPASVKEMFESAGYETEAVVPELFSASESGLFMARYYHKDRCVDHGADRVRQVLDAAHLKAGRRHPGALPEGCDCRPATPSDCGRMAQLYRQVFSSYPFPITDSAYLAGTMESDTIYAGVWKGGQPLALASAEIDRRKGCAELTDFATHPDWRGRGLAGLLLSCLETRLKKEQVRTGYTIARSTSYGMNICFARNGYRYGGTLVKNTQIAGRLESMNVWHRSLDSASGS